MDDIPVNTTELFYSIQDGLLETLVARVEALETRIESLEVKAGQKPEKTQKAPNHAY